MPFRAFHVRIVGMGRNDVQNIQGLIILLSAGIDLSSIRITINNTDHQTWTARAVQAEEMSRAADVLPAQRIFDENAQIWEALRQATQLYLNILPKDDNHCNRLEATGTFEAPCMPGGALPPRALGLRLPQGSDREDNLLLHEVQLANPAGTAPAYVAIAFFQEDMGEQNRTPERRIPRFRPGYQPPQPPSPTGRRRRDGDADASQGEGSPNQPQPQQPSSHSPTLPVVAGSSIVVARLSYVVSLRC